ncbi:MAG: (Fe-S)-binding protein [Methanosarcinales archaeon]
MKDIIDLLPGFNCGECGLRQCRDFAAALVNNETELTFCPHLYKDRFTSNIKAIEKILYGLKNSQNDTHKEPARIKGIIDGLEADFILAPLLDETSCREYLHPFDHETKPKVDEVLRYRPMGCPITHFARVLDVDKGIITVHMVGPLHRIGDKGAQYRDIGLCMIIGFDGIVSKGRVPDVSETVKFLPEHCMMQKVHSGVVVHSEGKRVRIESIDLKVW